MSNETDLDWLARNVNVWCLFCDAVAIVRDGEVTFHEPNNGFRDAITCDQWLARRAEMQGITDRFKPLIEEANKLAQELKLFTSIEDNQEQDMKQDNGWLERGELPPVGAACLYVVSDRISAEVEITAHAKFGICFVQVGQSGESYVSKTAELHRFRPIRTEREKAIEEMVSEFIDHYGDPKGAERYIGIATKLYEIGYRKESK